MGWSAGCDCDSGFCGQPRAAGREEPRPTDRPANCSFHLSCPFSWKCRRFFSSFAGLQGLAHPCFLILTPSRPSSSFPEPSAKALTQEGESKVTASRKAPECLCHREKSIIMIGPAREGQTGGILGAGFQTEQPAAQHPTPPARIARMAHVWASWLSW